MSDTAKKTLLLISVLTALWLAGTLQLVHVVIASLVGYVLLGGHHTLWLFYHTAHRDITAGVRYMRLRLLVRWAQGSDMCLADLFERNVTKNPHKVALIWEGRQWTFKVISEYSNRVGNLLASRGMRPGDCVALLMTNRPEYVATWLGAAKAGLVTALINSNLRHKSLYHCIAVAKASAVICGAELQDAIMEVQPLLGSMPVLVSGCDGTEAAGPCDVTVQGGIHLDEELLKQPVSPPDQLASVHFADRLLYIYTSGTTGLPKAAIITHARYLFFCGAVHFLADLTDTEVLYNPLPLYHTAGGMVGMGQVLVFNCTAVIRTKFSVSQYWKECCQYKCTVGQYVGEICRYLLNSPPSPHDTQHTVCVMFGNGVRPQVWQAFTARFQMPRIAEFYGATESNANIINFEGKPGACGFISLLAPSVYPVTLIRVDEKTGVPVRGDDGLCVVCKPGEAGEFVGKIKRQDPLRDFHGYADSAATEKKIVKDVFRKGDLAFLSGDILVCDELGYVYFKDRTGDTFRWRGENVSAQEVEGQVAAAAGNADAVVFGVEVPGAEGKAGMAVIVTGPADCDDEDADAAPAKSGPAALAPPVPLDAFLANLRHNLPPYAVPIFLRMVSSIDTTGTFKLKKLDLQKEGYNLPRLVKDDEHDEGHSLYFLDAKKGAYVPLTSGLLQSILDKKSGL